MPRFSTRVSAVALALVLVPSSSLIAAGQSGDFNIGLHASKHVTASDLGLPVYPGAMLDRGDHDDAAFDLGLGLGESQYRLRGVKYRSDDPAAAIFDFYRTALARYGPVLECDRGHAVGTLSRTPGGLTCRDHADIDYDDARASDHDLRAGSRHSFRLVAVDESSQPAKFILMFVEIPEQH